MKIMIVDDEAKIRNGLLKLLSAYRQWETPVVFGDAESAFEYLRENRVDVMITDIKMPEISGLELIRKIREINGQVEIIILSGYSNFAYAQKAIEMGVRRYLTKPTNPREVISILMKLGEELDSGRITDEEESREEKESIEVSNLAVAKAIQYVESNYAKKMTLRDIGDKLYLSPNYLCRLFKRHTGKNLSEFITEYRVEKAKGYLRDVRYKVSDVAGLVGFADTKYFSSTFKKLCGVTPMEFRNGKNSDTE